jgi:glutamate synthase (NADPH/NADH) small chain
MWNINTKKFIGENGQVKKVLAVQVEWAADEHGNIHMREIPGSEFEIEADVVLLAMGFVHVEQEGLVKDLGVKLDSRGNIDVDENYMSSREGVFAAGDANRGASLVVNCIQEGREAARGIDAYLQQ